MKERPTAGIYVFGQEVTDKRPILPIRAETNKTALGDTKIVSVSPIPAASESSPASAGLLSLADRILSPSQRYLLNITALPTSAGLQQVVRSIGNGTALLVSDGSYFPDTNEAAFQTILETGDRRHSITITQRVPGMMDVADSFRSEATGITAGNILILVLCKYFHIAKGRITQCCDGKAALKKSSHTWTVRSSEPHHDVLQLNQETIHQLPRDITIHRKWIKGHADATTHYDKLSRAHQLNILCDAGAKHFARSAAPPAPTQIKTQHWSIHWGGVRQVHKIAP